MIDMPVTFAEVATGEQHERHTSWGAEPFEIPENEWWPTDTSQFYAALAEAKQRGGGTIQVSGSLALDETAQIPSFTRVLGPATFYPSPSFEDNHFFDLRDSQGIWLDGLSLTGKNHNVKGVVVQRCRDVLMTDVNVSLFTNNIPISFSSGVTLVRVYSLESTIDHGFVVRERDLSSESVALLSCVFDGNASYGVDVHVAGFEMAGCIISGNGAREGSFEGVGIKMMDTVHAWVHHNSIYSGEGGEGLTPIYVTRADWSSRTPKNVNFYRNRIYSVGRHLYASDGAEVFVEANEYYNMDGEPVPFVWRLGAGTYIQSKPSLLQLGTDDGKNGEPPAPPEPAVLTEARVREIFAEEAAKLRVVLG